MRRHGRGCVRRCCCAGCQRLWWVCVHRACPKVMLWVELPARSSAGVWAGIVVRKHARGAGMCGVWRGFCFCLSTMMHSKEMRSRVLCTAAHHTSITLFDHFFLNQKRVEESRREENNQIGTQHSRVPPLPPLLVISVFQQKIRGVQALQRNRIRKCMLHSNCTAFSEQTRFFRAVLNTEQHALLSFDQH